jgi:hypothetical protein
VSNRRSPGPEWAAAMRHLTERLKALNPGEVISLDEIARIVGYSIEKRRAIYYAAERQAAIEAGVGMTNEPRQGYRCTIKSGGAYGQTALQPSVQSAMAAVNEIIAEQPPPSVVETVETEEPDPELVWRERFGEMAIELIRHWLDRP